MAKDLQSATIESNCFPTAEVHVVIPRRRQSKLKLAHVFVSSRIYWKEISGNLNDKPFPLNSFRNVDSLELTRLKGVSWDIVKETVKAEDNNGQPCIIVPGSLHGPMHRKYLLLVGNVKIILVPKTLEQRDAWLELIRARIAPWELIKERMKALASHTHSSRVEEIEKGIGRMIVASEPFSVPMNNAGNKWDKHLGALPERMEMLNPIDELVVHSTSAVETGAALVKLVASAEHVIETAEVVADIAKCVAGASTAFQLVVLSARVVSKFAESSRGRKVLPVAFGRITKFLHYVLQSLTEMMNPSLSMETIDEDFVLGVLRQTVDTVDIIETQLLRGWGSQLLNSKVVKEVELTMEQLEHKVMTVSNTSSMSVFHQKLTELESELHRPSDELHHVRPEISPFFVGRTKELRELRKALEKRGSAVITQYGGAGKTELMIAFAERAERNNEVSGGVFWVSVGGSVASVIDSLSSLVEKVSGRKITEKDRQDPNVIVAGLKSALAKRKGRWMLCLDNADHSDVGGILSVVCGIARASCGMGWVLITSRQGPRTWSGINDDQILVLQSLSEEDAMVVMWRQSRVIKTEDADEDAVMAEITKLKEANSVQYYALNELCGDEGAHSLGGLPLALVQAGTYIRRFECSFEEYLNLFKNANKTEDLDNIMEKSEQLSLIRDEQRSILTTWRISVERLSAKAYSVLRAISMLGPAPISESIVKGILKAAAGENDTVDKMFRNVFTRELVHSSSLIYQVQAQGMHAYGMHRLVRRFILGDMERNSLIWEIVFNLALHSMHEQIEEVLEEEGKSFDDNIIFFGEHHREFMPHMLELINHLVIPSSSCDVNHSSKLQGIHRYSRDIVRGFLRNREIMQVRRRSGCDADQFSKLQNIFRYSGHLLRFFGRIRQEVQVWRSLLRILEHRYGKGKMNDDIITVLCNLGQALEATGKLDEAKSALERSLEMSRVVYKTDKAHPAIAASLDNLALVYKSQGDLRGAARMFKESLEMKRIIHGDDSLHLGCANSLNNLAVVFRKQGKLEEAYSMLEESLKIYRSIHDDDLVHLSMAISLANLADVCYKQGKLEKASALHKESLEMKRSIYGHDSMHPNIAASLSYLADVNLKQGKLEEASILHKESLEMKRSFYGDDSMHSDVANSLSNLAKVYQRQGKLGQAATMFEECLAMNRCIYWDNSVHLNIANSLNNLALVYERQGKLEQAAEMIEESIEIYRSIYGDCAEHPNIAVSLNNLALVNQRQGKIDEASKMFKESIEIYRSIRGDCSVHRHIAVSLNNLALLYQRQEKWKESAKMFEESIKIYQSINREDSMNHDIAVSIGNLAEVYRKQGKLKKASTLHKKSLEMKRSIYGNGLMHSDIAKSLNNLARVNYELGNVEEASILLKESLEIYRSIYCDDTVHLDIASTLNNFGLVCQRQRKFEEAAKGFEESIKIFRSIHGDNSVHRHLTVSIEGLAKVYRKQGKLELALQFYKESLQMKRCIHGEDPLSADIAKSLNNLAKVCHELGKWEESSKLLEESLEIYRSIHIEHSVHPLIACTLNNLALVYKKQGKLERAAKVFEERSEMDRSIEGDPMHHDVTVSL